MKMISYCDAETRIKKFFEKDDEAFKEVVRLRDAFLNQHKGKDNFKIHRNEDCHGIYFEIFGEETALFAKIMVM